MREEIQKAAFEGLELTEQQMTERVQAEIEGIVNLCHAILAKKEILEAVSHSFYTEFQRLKTQTNLFEENQP